MNSVKIAYLILITISDTLWLTAAILIPIYITPGWYVWSVILGILVILNGVAVNAQLNGWKWDK